MLKVPSGKQRCVDVGGAPRALPRPFGDTCRHNPYAGGLHAHPGSRVQVWLNPQATTMPASEVVMPTAPKVVTTKLPIAHPGRTHRGKPSQTIECPARRSPAERHFDGAACPASISSGCRSRLPLGGGPCSHMRRELCRSRGRVSRSGRVQSGA